MHAAALSFDLHVPASRSLKAKRAAIRPIVDGMRHRFRISVAEVGHQDQWQRATIAVAVVAESEGRVRELLDAAERFVAGAPGVELLRCQIGWLELEDAVVVHRGSVRRYPRMARVNEVVREVIADELERLSDPRLGLVTVTGVEVSADLRHATVYYSALDSGREQHQRSRRRRAASPAAPQEGAHGEEPPGEVDVTPTADAQAAFKEQTAVALRSAAPHIRAALGRQVRMKYTPELHFREDPAIEQGERVEAIIRSLHSRDERRGPE